MSSVVDVSQSAGVDVFVSGTSSTVDSRNDDKEDSERPAVGGGDSHAPHALATEASFPVAPVSLSPCGADSSEMDADDTDDESEAYDDGDGADEVASDPDDELVRQITNPSAVAAERVLRHEEQPPAAGGASRSIEPLPPVPQSPSVDSGVSSTTSSPSQRSAHSRRAKPATMEPVPSTPKAEEPAGLWQRFKKWWSEPVERTPMPSYTAPLMAGRPVSPAQSPPSHRLTSTSTKGKPRPRTEQKRGGAASGADSPRRTPSAVSRSLSSSRPYAFRGAAYRAYSSAIRSESPRQEEASSTPKAVDPQNASPPAAAQSDVVAVTPRRRQKPSEPQSEPRKASRSGRRSLFSPSPTVSTTAARQSRWKTTNRHRKRSLYASGGRHSSEATLEERTLRKRQQNYLLRSQSGQLRGGPASQIAPAPWWRLEQSEVDVLRDHLKRLNARSQRSLSMSGVGSGSGDKIVKDQLSVASTRRRGKHQRRTSVGVIPNLALLKSPTLSPVGVGGQGPATGPSRPLVAQSAPVTPAVLSLEQSQLPRVQENLTASPSISPTFSANTQRKKPVKLQMLSPRSQLLQEQRVGASRPPTLRLEADVEDSNKQPSERQSPMATRGPVSQVEKAHWRNMERVDAMYKAKLRNRRQKMLTKNLRRVQGPLSSRSSSSRARVQPKAASRAPRRQHHRSSSSRSTSKSRHPSEQFWVEVVIPQWDLVHHTPLVLKVWDREGIPPRLRGIVWSKAVGNGLEVSEATYFHYLPPQYKRARHARERASRQLKAAQFYATRQEERKRRKELKKRRTPEKQRHRADQRSLSLHPRELPFAAESQAITATQSSSAAQNGGTPTTVAAVIGADAGADVGSTKDKPSSSSSAAHAPGSASSSQTKSGNTKGKTRHRRRPSDDKRFEFGKQRRAAIHADVERMFASLDIQKRERHLDRLKELLETFCNYNPDVSYVQGMSYLASVFLEYMSAPKAFVSLSNLMCQDYFLSYVEMDVEEIRLRFKIFSVILKANMPTLYKRFKDLSLIPDCYLMEWCMTLFAKQMPLSIASRVWDGYFIYGELYIFKTAVALIKILEQQLMTAPLAECMRMLRQPPASFSVEDLVATIASISVPKRVRLYYKKKHENPLSTPVFRDSSDVSAPSSLQSSPAVVSSGSPPLGGGAATKVASPPLTVRPSPKDPPKLSKISTAALTGMSPLSPLSPTGPLQTRVPSPDTTSGHSMSTGRISPGDEDSHRKREPSSAQGSKASEVKDDTETPPGKGVRLSPSLGSAWQPVPHPVVDPPVLPTVVGHQQGAVSVTSTTAGGHVDEAHASVALSRSLPDRYESLFPTAESQGRSQGRARHGRVDNNVTPPRRSGSAGASRRRFGRHHHLAQRPRDVQRTQRGHIPIEFQRTPERLLHYLKQF